MTASGPLGREKLVTAAFAELADTLVDDYDVVDLLHRLAMHCVNLLDVAAAGLLLTDGQGNLRLLASSNEQARLMELLQLQGDDLGPCAESFRTGQRIDIVDLSSHRDRWPEFVDEAARQDFRCVHALPMQLRAETIGTLNLFRTTATALGHDDLLLGAALADIATIGILHQRALRRSETVVEQLQGALHSRIVIEQAKGMIAERAQIDPEEAFRLLRNHARSHRQLLSEVATRLINNRDQIAAILPVNDIPGEH